MNGIQKWIWNMSFINSESKPGSECISSTRENERGTLFIELFHSRAGINANLLELQKKVLTK